MEPANRDKTPLFRPSSSPELQEPPTSQQEDQLEYCDATQGDDTATNIPNENDVVEDNNCEPEPQESETIIPPTQRMGKAHLKGRKSRQPTSLPEVVTMPPPPRVPLPRMFYSDYERRYDADDHHLALAAVQQDKSVKASIDCRRRNNTN